MVANTGSLGEVGEHGVPVELPRPRKYVGEHIANLRLCAALLEEYGDEYVISYTQGRTSMGDVCGNYRLSPRNAARGRWVSDARGRFQYFTLHHLRDIKDRVDRELCEIDLDGVIGRTKPEYVGEDRTGGLQWYGREGQGIFHEKRETVIFT